MRALVTGGAGFIGSQIVDALLRDRHEVVVVDDLDPAAHDGIPEGIATEAEYVWRDLRDPDGWRHVLGRVDAVCHQAAKVGLGVEFGDVTEYVSRNDLGTASLLRELHDVGFHGRLVLASSMVVYGEGRYRCAVHGIVRPGPRAADDLAIGRFEPPCPICGRGLTPEAVPEDAPTDPRNVYAVSKLAQEGLCSAYAREHPGCVATMLRYHNVYGHRMPRDTPYAGVASLFRSAWERGEAPIVHEDGGQLRDFVHVADVARANVLALTGDRAVAGPLNVCSGTPHSILDLALAMQPAGAPAPCLSGSHRLGDVRHVFASPARAADLLGFRAEVGFADGVHDFVTAPLRRRASASLTLTGGARA